MPAGKPNSGEEEKEVKEGKEECNSIYREQRERETGGIKYSGGDMGGEGSSRESTL